MISIGTLLHPRTPSDPAATVVGVEPEQGRYLLAPLEFGSVFAMDLDALTSTYDCSAYKVALQPFSEAREWAKLSSEKFHGKLAEVRRHARQEAALESPNEVFAREAAEAAEAAK